MITSDYLDVSLLYPYAFAFALFKYKSSQGARDGTKGRGGGGNPPADHFLKDFSLHIVLALPIFSLLYVLNQDGTFEK